MGPYGLAAIGTRNGSRGYPSHLRPNGSQSGMKLMEERPGDPHRWIMGPVASHLSLCGALSAGVAEMVPNLSDCPKLNLRQEVRVETWNVHSLGQDNRMPVLSRELIQLKNEVAALSEMRRPSSSFISPIAVYAPTDVLLTRRERDDLH